MMTGVQVNYLATYGAGRLTRPCGITTDEAMHIYVAQGPIGRVTIFDENGKLLMKFGQGEGGFFKEVGKLGAPMLVLDIQHDQGYDMPGCIANEQCLPGPVGVHLVLADPWSKEWGQPQGEQLLFDMGKEAIFFAGRSWT